MEPLALLDRLRFKLFDWLRCCISWISSWDVGIIVASFCYYHPDSHSGILLLCKNQNQATWNVRTEWSIDAGLGRGLVLNNEIAALQRMHSPRNFGKAPGQSRRSEDLSKQGRRTNGSGSRIGVRAAKGSKVQRDKGEPWRIKRTKYWWGGYHHDQV